MDRANRHVLTVTFSDISNWKVTGHSEGPWLPLPLQRTQENRS
jgi:hypothetical protein